jgi:hypothetical protein
VDRKVHLFCLFVELERAKEFFSFSIRNDGNQNDMTEEYFELIGVIEELLNWWPKNAVDQAQNSKRFNNNYLVRVTSFPVTLHLIEQKKIIHITNDRFGAVQPR